MKISAFEPNEVTRKSRSNLRLRGFDKAADFALRRFERRTGDAAAVNRRTLLSILRRNRATLFGRDNGFDAMLRSDDPLTAWQERMPLRGYAGFETYVDRIAAGESRVLTRDRIDLFAGSAGTTGAPKRLPSTKRARRKFMFFVPLVQQGAIRRALGVSARDGRGINLMSTFRPDSTEESRIPVMSANNAGMRRVRRQIPLLWTSPAPVFEIADQQTAWYLHALFGLADPGATHIAAVFASQMAAFLRIVESQSDRLVRDLETGRPSLHL
ncbi:MAG: GH3 auxin-responsive promoter family protein, partial [Thiotrichales bacterium]|nr:GH3 auxin-responsive promoter family protein [Thiotrichales bacterium]